MLSEIAMEQVRSGRYSGPLGDATHYGVSGSPGDGPSVEIWLVVERDVIERIAYRTHGCPSSQAASAMLCRVSTGRTVEQASQLTDKDLLLILGGLPDGKGHFATMAVAALQSSFAGPCK
jgi:NifU-like protein involved in Fe-S cluster formation